MKRIAIALCTSVILFACGENKTTDETKKDDTSATTTSEATDEDWVPVDSATAMKSMMEAGTPGEMHKMLAKYDGNWTAQTTMWMKPGAPPVTGTGSSTNKMIMGGRYQESTFKGDFMGMPYEGSGVSGYDNTKKVFFTTWMDNMSTAIMTMEGTWDDASKTINFTGKMPCPANGKEMTMKQVCKYPDENTMTMEMYGPDMQTGKEYKHMEMTLTRKK